MIDSESAQIFRTEAQELFDQIEHGLLDLERHPDDLEIVAGLFRALHTLKGSGAMFGYDALAALAHRCETAFDRVRKGKSQVTPDLIGAALTALDSMQKFAEGNIPTEGTDESAFLVFDNSIEASAEAETNNSILLGSESPRETPTFRWRILMRFPRNALANGTRPLVMLDEIRTLGTAKIFPQTDGIPPLDALAPRDFFIGWIVELETKKDKSVIENIFAFDALSMELLIENITADKDTLTLPPYDDATQENAPSTTLTPVQLYNDKTEKIATSVIIEETVRVPAPRLDTLMDRVGELVIAQSRLRQIAGIIEDTNLSTVTEEIERLTAELRESMMSVRMVPISQLFSRFRRLVRDLGKETGKPIDFITSGEATELDKSVIERLADPLIHLIRNAADHGLETAEERKKTGKKETGKITLSAYQAGAEVIISIEDDGRGVDRRRVRAKAEKNGLISPGTHLNDNDILQLLFQPGFSTAKKVTGLSGRGVGMDVVKRAIEALRGTIEMHSDYGIGSRILLRIPLTLAIIDGLLVRVSADRYVIPLSVIEECLDFPHTQKYGDDRSIITLREGIVPYLRLNEIFESDRDNDHNQMVVIVSIGQDRVGLVVDEIIGDHQTVIKPLSAFHTNVGNFSGATILGDGSVALILDASHLIAIGKKREERMSATG